MTHAVWREKPLYFSPRLASLLAVRACIVHMHTVNMFIVVQTYIDILIYNRKRESTKQMASRGMKMNNLRKVLLGKANFNLTLIV